MLRIPQAHTRPKLVNGSKPLAINTNSSIIDVYQGSELATEGTTIEEVT